MEFLLVDEDGEAQMVKGREMNSEELAMVEEGSWIAFRFRGNVFEQAEVIDASREVEDGEDEVEVFDVEWTEVPRKDL